MANFDLLQVHSPNDLDLVRRGPLAPAAELVLFAEVGLPFPTSVNTRAHLHACAIFLEAGLSTTITLSASL